MCAGAREVHRTWTPNDSISSLSFQEINIVDNNFLYILRMFISKINKIIHYLQLKWNWRNTRFRSTIGELLTVEQWISHWLASWHLAVGPVAQVVFPRDLHRPFECLGYEVHMKMFKGLIPWRESAREFWELRSLCATFTLLRFKSVRGATRPTPFWSENCFLMIYCTILINWPKKNYQLTFQFLYGWGEEGGNRS